MSTYTPAHRHIHTPHIYTTHSNNEDETMDGLALLLQSWGPHEGVTMLKGKSAPSQVNTDSL